MPKKYWHDRYLSRLCIRLSPLISNLCSRLRKLIPNKFVVAPGKATSAGTEYSVMLPTLILSIATEAARCEPIKIEHARAR